MENNKEKKHQDDAKKKLELAQSIASKGKTVVRTYASIENAVARLIKNISSCIDRYIFTPRWAGLVSLIIAVFLYLTINNGVIGQMFESNKTGQILENIPVTVLANQDVYEITGLPESVNAMIVGELNDVQMAKAQGGYLIVADLSGLGEGTHAITLTANNVFSPRVQVSLTPSTAVVTIKKKISVLFQVGYNFINTDKMDARYILGTPVLETNEASIRASQETIDRIAFVNALIDVSNVSESFQQDAALAAYDQSGQRLDVDFVPSKIKVNVDVTSPSKTVPIVIEPVGEIPNNQAIKEISLDHEALTIYGPESVLATMSEFRIKVPVSQVTSNKSLVASIVLPTGVKKASIKKVNLSIELTDAVSKTFTGIPINFRNNTNNYKLSLVDGDDKQLYYVDVVVTGSQERIEALTAEDLEAYIDLRNIEPGKHSVQILVDGKDLFVKKTSVKERMDIELVR